MRFIALVVLMVMIAAALWFWRPELFRPWLGDTPLAGTDATAPPAPGSGSATPRPAGSPAPSGDHAPKALDAVTPRAAPGAVAPGAALDAVTPRVAPAASPAQVEREARSYVQILTRVEPAPLSAERADHFVSGEQVLKLLPEAAARTMTVAQIESSSLLKPDTPITVIRSVEQVELASPGKLIADSGGNLDAPVRQVLADDSVRSTTVREVVEQLRARPEAVVRVLRDVDYFVQTTPAELLADEQIERSAPIRIVTGNHGIELASVRDLIPAEQLTPDSLFYVRTVREGDDQGIWGIVHDGIIDNFARGIAIRRGREVNTYQVEIPQDADEKRADATSSFLGRLIHLKSRRSYVYNLREKRMGRNPDRIRPGQEIIIINFEPDELIGIYKHFVNERG